MSALSCCCNEIIEKEGLAHYLREYLSGITVQCYREGMSVEHLFYLLAQILEDAIVGSKQLPSGYEVNREPTFTEKFVISSTFHMILESRTAGYNAKAFRESLKEAMENATR